MIVKMTRILFLLLIAVFDCHAFPTTKKLRTTCKTHPCRGTGEYILRNMDRSSNPCDDFYQFSCGNYMKNTDIPVTKVKMDPSVEIYDTILNKLRYSIENDIRKSDPKSFKKLSIFYKSCVDENFRERRSELEFIELTRKLGGWPVLEDTWDGGIFDWKETMYNFQDQGLPYDFFINAEYVSDSRDPNEFFIRLNDVKLKFPPEALKDDVKMKSYSNYMVTLAEAFGAFRRQAERDFQEVLEFQIQLTEQRDFYSRRRNPTTSYKRSTIAELFEECPHVNWDVYLTRILDLPKPLSRSDSVIDTMPGFLGMYCDLLSSIRKRALANYVFWSVAFDMGVQLSSRTRKMEDQMLTQISGGVTPKHPPVWVECVHMVRQKMHLAAGALYVRRHFDEESKPFVSDIYSRVRHSYEMTFEQVDWVNFGVKAAAAAKLGGMKEVIGYPDELMDDKELDEFYKDLEVHRESLLKNLLSANRHADKIARNKFRKNGGARRPDWTSFFGDATNINSFYSYQDNAFVILAGNLQGAFFNVSNPNYMNYGGIGSVIGHEIMHAFDNTGRQFDQNGRFKNWWDPVTESEYLRKSQCFVEQHNSLATMKNLYDNDNKILAENIADTEGLRQAYRAYKIWREDHKEVNLLDGLQDFSPQQMFWLSYANTHCAKVKPEFSGTLSPHATNRLRVIEPLMNLREFSADFGCEMGSFMSPPNKCSIW